MDNESALEAANQALAGRGPRSMGRVLSSELSFESGTGGWELAAMACVALAAVLAVVALWFL